MHLRRNTQKTQTQKTATETPRGNEWERDLEKRGIPPEVSKVALRATAPPPAHTRLSHQTADSPHTPTHTCSRTHRATLHGHPPPQPSTPTLNRCFFCLPAFFIFPPIRPSGGSAARAAAAPQGGVPQGGVPQGGVPQGALDRRMASASRGRARWASPLLPMRRRSHAGSRALTRKRGAVSTGTRGVSTRTRGVSTGRSGVQMAERGVETARGVVEGGRGVESVVRRLSFARERSTCRRSRSAQACRAHKSAHKFAHKFAHTQVEHTSLQSSTLSQIRPHVTKKNQKKTLPSFSHTYISLPIPLFPYTRQPIPTPSICTALEVIYIYIYDLSTPIPLSLTHPRFAHTSHSGSSHTHQPVFVVFLNPLSQSTCRAGLCGASALFAGDVRALARGRLAARQGAAAERLERAAAEQRAARVRGARRRSVQSASRAPPALIATHPVSQETRTAQLSRCRCLYASVYIPLCVYTPPRQLAPTLMWFVVLSLAIFCPPHGALLFLTYLFLTYLDVCAGCSPR